MPTSDVAKFVDAAQPPAIFLVVLAILVRLATLEKLATIFIVIFASTGESVANVETPSAILHNVFSVAASETSALNSPRMPRVLFTGTSGMDANEESEPARVTISPAASGAMLTEYTCHSEDESSGVPVHALTVTAPADPA